MMLGTRETRSSSNWLPIITYVPRPKKIAPFLSRVQRRLIRRPGTNTSKATGTLHAAHCACACPGRSPHADAPMPWPQGSTADGSAMHAVLEYICT